MKIFEIMGNSNQNGNAQNGNANVAPIPNGTRPTNGTKPLNAPLTPAQIADQEKQGQQANGQPQNPNQKVVTASSKNGNITIMIPDPNNPNGPPVPYVLPNQMKLNANGNNSNVS